MMPVLPPELECLVVKFALRQKPVDAATRQALSVVARRFRVWVDEVVHETVLIDGSMTAQLFLDAVKERTLNPELVKHLCITHSVPWEEAASIAEMCTEVKALAMWSICHKSTTLFAALSHLHLSLLSIELSQLNAIPLVSHWLQLRYLEVILFHNPTVTELVATLRRLRALTHLSLLVDEIAENHITGVLNACQTLQVVVVLMHLPVDAEVLVVDDRVVVLQEPLLPLREWYAKVDGEENVWTAAEAVIARRRSQRQSTVHA